MELFALVGSSGTGKSYKAMNLIREYNIDYLIDDGILISQQKKIAGSSAKREKTKVGAVKRAIFFYDEYKEIMIETIKKENPKKLLIIGTSDKMVVQIAKNLDIEPIDKYIYIDDISTKKEIETALFHRAQYGKHVIPLPTLEIKDDFSGYFLSKLNIFSRVFGKKDIVVEKSVVRPTFSFMGKYIISTRTLIEIIKQSIKVTNGVHKHTKIRVIKQECGLKLEIDIVVIYGYNVTRVGQKSIGNIKKYLELMTQMNVVSIKLAIVDLYIKE